MATITPLRNLCPEALAKLKDSDLTPAQAAELGIYSVDNARAELHKSFLPIKALVIPYDKAKGLGGFYRIRYLEPPPRGFVQKQPGKYSQLPGSGVEAYFPNVVDWETIMRDVREEIIFTEGELKAACACMRGFTTIGLGGVYNFKTKETTFIFGLEEIDWQDRDVFICYDSDAADNAHVQMAMNRLTEELRERGARVHIIDLPAGPRRSKVGLDDYLVAHTDEEFIALAKEARDPDPREFFQMNEDVCYVRNIDRFVSINDDDPPMTLSTLVSSSNYAVRTFDVPMPGRNNSVVFKSMPVAPAWVKWPRRHVRRAIVYEPGQLRLIDKGLNQWPGWGCESKKGDVQPFLDLVNLIFEAEEPTNKTWFLDWCAYPIQNPGAKLAQAVIVHGVAQGTGKTLLGLLLGDIYGKNFYPLSPTDLRSQFNGWAHYRQFIVGDEISTGDKRELNDKMKSMVTQELVSINIKHQPTFAIKDCINYYFTSNHPDAVYLENFDRRFFVVRVPHTRPREHEFYRAIIAWRDAGGAEHLRYWLEHRKISAGFYPSMEAPRTRAREAMILAGLSDVDQWCLELKDNADNILTVGQLKHQRDLFTAEELLVLFQRDHDERRQTKPRGMSNALHRAGFEQVYDGQVVRVSGRAARYFAIRHANYWLNPPTRAKIEPWLRTNIELPPK